jgi:hypothetical protein
MEVNMTEAEFEFKMNNFELDDEYAEYIIERCGGDRIICNDHTLIKAIEDGYLFESFKDSKVTQ